MENLRIGEYYETGRIMKKLILPPNHRRKQGVLFAPVKIMFALVRIIKSKSFINALFTFVATVTALSFIISIAVLLLTVKKGFRLYPVFYDIVGFRNDSVNAILISLITVFFLQFVYSFITRRRSKLIQAANVKLQTLDEQKTEFLSNVSHEIRTPLTSVLGFAELIKKSFEKTVLPHVDMEGKNVRRSVDHIRENIDTIISEGKRLTALLNDVLDITKMEAGKIDWHKDRINVRQLLNHSVKATSMPEQRKDDLKVVIKNERNIPDTIGDFNKIHQVILNLISNALKFSTEGYITLKAACSNDRHQLTISVQDHGIGIPEEKQELIFEKFKQLGNTLTNKPMGTGLGLHICKEIVAYHGGRIWVQSVEGQGSTFYFTLPVIKADED
ncbi:MAG: HAMP domain-containing histidine kinase [Nitrospirae bacterium]|nr:HAMP domain-containing histidine kinase [Nitrospirota bacterium]